MALRTAFGAIALSGLLLGLMAILAFALIGEEAGTNSYILLAEAFLNGRLDVPSCFDGDCALYEGRTYVIFPPVPAVLVLPFVAIFGESFVGFIPVSLFLGAVSIWMWWQIFETQSSDRTVIALLVVALIFATPYFHAVLRSDSVWFFAQAIAFFLVTAGLWAAIRLENPILAGFFIGLAFLSRQFSILYMPLLLVLMMDKDRPFYHITRARILLVAKLAIGPAAAILIYLIYNHVRFGDPLETGYQYIFPEEWMDLEKPETLWIDFRVRELGLFSAEYLPFNLFHMFLAGPNLEFVGRHLTETGSFNPMGFALFIVAPFLLFVFLVPVDLKFVVAIATSLLIMTLTLFYHSNGYSQFSIQRYVLDWLPMIFLLLAPALTRERIGIFAVLLMHSLFVSMGALGVAFVTHV